MIAATERREQEMAAILKEFRDFVTRGNIVELAIAFVLGVAFAAVVDSLVADLVMPIVAMIVGEPDFRGLDFTINDAEFRYGAFITQVITFVAIAAAVFFFVVKPLSVLAARRRQGLEEPAEPSEEELRHRELVALLERIAAK
jgi:large conductance mechanosensitive channel